MAGYGFQPSSVSGSPFSLASPLGPQPQGSSGGVTGFLGNLIGGVQAFAGGISQLVGAGFHDVGRGIAQLIPGQTQLGFINDVDKNGYLFDNIVTQLPSAFLDDLGQRYGPLLKGDFGEFGNQLYNNPLAFGLDALAATSALGKVGMAATGEGLAGKIATGLGMDTGAVASDVAKLRLLREASGYAARYGEGSLGTVDRFVEGGITSLADLSSLEKAMANTGTLSRFSDWATAEPRLVGSPLTGDVRKMRSSINPIVRRAVADPIQRRFLYDDVAVLEQKLSAMQLLEKQGGLGPVEVREMDRLQEILQGFKRQGVTAVDQPRYANMPLKWGVDALLGRHMADFLSDREDMLRSLKPAVDAIPDELKPTFHRIIEGYDTGDMQLIDLSTLEGLVQRKGFSDIGTAARAVLSDPEAASRLAFDEQAALLGHMTKGNLTVEGAGVYIAPADIRYLPKRAAWEQSLRDAANHMHMPSEQQDVAVMFFDSIARGLYDNNPGRWGSIDDVFDTIHAGYRVKPGKLAEDVLRQETPYGNFADELNVERLADGRVRISGWHANTSQNLDPSRSTHWGTYNAAEQRINSLDVQDIPILIKDATGEVLDTEYVPGAEASKWIDDAMLDDSNKGVYFEYEPIYEPSFWLDPVEDYADQFSPVETEGRYLGTDDLISDELANEVDRAIKDGDPELALSEGDARRLFGSDAEAAKAEVYPGTYSTQYLTDNYDGLLYRNAVEDRGSTSVLSFPGKQPVALNPQWWGEGMSTLVDQNLVERLSAVMPETPPAQLQGASLDLIRENLVASLRTSRVEGWERYSRELVDAHPSQVEPIVAKMLKDPKVAPAVQRFRSRYTPDILANQVQGTIKGAIKFGPDFKAAISFFRNGDLTTAFHEGGHWLRRYLPKDVADELHDLYANGGTIEGVDTLAQSMPSKGIVRTVKDGFEVTDEDGVVNVFSKEERKDAIAFAKQVKEKVGVEGVGPSTAEAAGVGPAEPIHPSDVHPDEGLPRVPLSERSAWWFGTPGSFDEQKALQAAGKTPNTWTRQVMWEGKLYDVIGVWEGEGGGWSRGLKLREAGKKKGFELARESEVQIVGTKRHTWDPKMRHGEDIPGGDQRPPWETASADPDAAAKAEYARLKAAAEAGEEGYTVVKPGEELPQPKAKPGKSGPVRTRKLEGSEFDTKAAEAGVSETHNWTIRDRGTGEVLEFHDGSKNQAMTRAVELRDKYPDAEVMDFDPSDVKGEVPAPPLKPKKTPKSKSGPVRTRKIEEPPVPSEPVNIPDLIEKGPPALEAGKDWSRPMEEAFARDVERYVFGKVARPDARVAPLFEGIKDALKNIWANIREVSEQYQLIEPRVMNVLDDYLGDFSKQLRESAALPWPGEPRRMRRLAMPDASARWGDGKLVSQVQEFSVTEAGDLGRSRAASNAHTVGREVYARAGRRLKLMFPNAVEGRVKTVSRIMERLDETGGMAPTDVVGFRIKLDNWSRTDDAIQALNDGGFQVLGVEDSRAVPLPSGERTLVAKVVSKEDPRMVFEVELGTELYHRVRDATSAANRRFHSGTRDLAKTTDEMNQLHERILAGDTSAMDESIEVDRRFLAQQRHVDASARRLQGIWEVMADQLDQQMFASPISSIQGREALAGLRLWVTKLEDAGLDTGLWDEEYLFDRQYLPLRVQDGAVWDPKSKDFDGGRTSFELDDVQKTKGLPQPFYFPHIEPPTSFSDWLMPRKRIGMRKMAWDPHLARDTAKLLNDDNYVKDIYAAYSHRAARALKMRDTYQLVQKIANEYGRRISSAEDLIPGEMVFAPNGMLNFFNVSIGLEDRFWALASKLRQAGIKNLRDLGLAPDEDLANIISKGVKDKLKGSDSVEQAALAQAVLDMMPEVQRNITGVTKNGVEMYAIPEIVAKRLEESTLPKFGLRARLFWDTPTNVWRSLTLAGRPAWVMNNLVGNVLFIKLQGARLSDVLRIVGDPDFRGMTEEIAGLPEVKGVTTGFWDEPQQYMTRLGKAGETATGQLYDRISRTKVVGVGRSIGHRVRRFNAALEDTFRQASMIRALDDVTQVRRNTRSMVDAIWTSKNMLEDVVAHGLTPEQGAKVLAKVNGALGDFTKLTPIERQVIRRFLMPFYGFYRHATLTMLRMPFEHPLKMEVLQGLNRLHEDMIAEQGPMPEWLADTLPIGPGLYLSTAGPNPMNVLDQTALSLLHPALKVLIEQGTGRSSFTGRQFTDPNVFTPYGSEQQWRVVKDAAGQPVDAYPIGHVAPNIIEHLLQQVPQYEQVEDLISGGRTYDTTTMFQVLANAAGRGQEQTVIDPDTGQPVAPVGLINQLGKTFGLSVFPFNLQGYQDRYETQREQALKMALEAYGAGLL